MLGRVARAGATAVIAGVLVFAVPISAQAYLDPITTGEYVLGAVRAAAPVEAGAGIIGPEGTLIVSTAVTIGALAYATRDTWMPWVAGLFGAGGSSTAKGTAATPAAVMTWSGPSSGDATVLGVTASSGSLSPNNIVATVTMQCATAGGINTSANWGPGYLFVGMGANQVKTNGSMVACAVGSTITSAQGTFTQDGSGGGSLNSLTWGKSFDPQTGATYTVASNCIKPDGTTGTITATTANPGLGGLMVPSCVAAFGPGSRGSQFVVSGGQTGTTPHQLSTYPVPTDAQTAVLYPNCVGVGAIACTYIVEYQGVACTVGQAECVNWTLRDLAYPADYSCFYGPYFVSNIDLCSIDERAYEPNGTRLTKLNTDGDPWTYDSPAPAGMPEVAPGTGTSTGTAPGPGTGTGTGTVPGGSTGTTPSPTGVPLTNGDCWSGGAFSWNPVDWVLTPIKCGLSWAFVPRTATLATLTATAKTNLTTQGIGPMVAAVTTNVSKVGGSGTGCTGPSVTFAAVGITKVMTPFNACTAPMSTLASISYAMTTIVVVLGGGFVAVKAVGAGFGFNFSMRRGGGDSA